MLSDEHSTDLCSTYKNLYSKKTRFLYELIQNAEDNSYSIATGNGSLPFLSFELHPDKIIVNSNEDGFSQENVDSICSVANSTKQQSAGYIGEKGIGFKSVFKVAKKVHIQSGPFSFALFHTKEDNDDGLGLVTPWDEDPEDLPEHVRTRMTLTLLDPSKFEELATEFRGVPDTFLMFLSQLRKITIRICPTDDVVAATKYSKRETEENGLCATFLKKVTLREKKMSISEQKYYTTKRDLFDLPFDENRIDKNEHSIDQTTVILGFPIDEQNEPVLEDQYTYAFLPLRQVGFKFLIQADFVTQMNREDVEDSARNRAVLKGVAEAFSDAVASFCKHPSLRYRWMRYLPNKSTTKSLWGSLGVQIGDKLKETPLLESWSGTGLYKPADLECLTQIDIAEDGTPLLRDVEGAELYLSPKYTAADVEILASLGTTFIDWDHWLDRLEADLNRSSGSRWRSIGEDTDWRTRICENLLEAFDPETGSPSVQERLRSLDMIPLNDDQWISYASENQLYCPNTGKIPIPVDLGLDVIHNSTSKNAAWAKFLSALGVIDCPPETVISWIRKRYAPRNMDKLSVKNAVTHIRYLYWFTPKDQMSNNPHVRLYNQHRALLRREQLLYFPNDEDEYGLSELFKKDEGFPGHSVNYLREEYLCAVKPEVIRNGWSWMRWLEEILDVRRIPEICSQAKDGLSPEFKYIVDFRSKKLLGVLKRGWTYYCPRITDATKVALANSKVLLGNGRKKPLSRTFLPFPKLERIAAELCVANSFPFIAMSEPLHDEEQLEWIFVRKLEVSVEDNLDFYLRALETFKDRSGRHETASTQDQIIRIYQKIHFKSSEDVVRVL